MRYKKLQVNEEVFKDLELSDFMKKSLYYVCKDEINPMIFFKEDKLQEVCQSEEYLICIDRINEAIENEEKIIISGDYDCDGICATTLMYKCLKARENNAGYYIPNRKKDGYGLSIKLVEMYKQKDYSLIICVDNGVIAHDAIELADSYGIDVVILDHHELDDRSHDYPYLLHPSLMGEGFENLCGSGVVFEVMRSLVEIEPYDYSLCALATVGDMMKLTNENRAIVRIGLSYMNSHPCLPLMALNNNEPFTVSTFAMRLSPRLNACGRLYDSCNVNMLVKYLLSTDPKEIEYVAKQIEDINKLRQTITKEALAKYDLDLGFSYPAIFIKGVIHEGIVGLVASSLVHAYHRFCMVISEENGICKGSIRSIEGIDIVKMLRNYPNLIAFGGHELAGGITFVSSDYDELIKYITDYILNLKMEEKLIDVIEADIDGFEINEIEKLNALKPFISVQAEPLYMIENLDLNQHIIYMSNQMHCKWKIGNIEIIYFNCNFSQIDLTKPCSVVGKIDVNEFRNNKSINIKISDIFNTNLS